MFPYSPDCNMLSRVLRLNIPDAYKSPPSLNVPSFMLLGFCCQTLKWDQSIFQKGRKHPSQICSWTSTIFSWHHFLGNEKSIKWWRWGAFLPLGIIHSVVLLTVIHAQVPHRKQRYTRHGICLQGLPILRAIRSLTMKSCITIAFLLLPFP